MTRNGCSFSCAVRCATVPRWQRSPRRRRWKSVGQHFSSTWSPWLAGICVPLAGVPRFARCDSRGDWVVGILQNRRDQCPPRFERGNAAHLAPSCGYHSAFSLRWLGERGKLAKVTQTVATITPQASYFSFRAIFFSFWAIFGAFRAIFFSF
jgi:hypothetical protein